MPPVRQHASISAGCHLHPANKPSTAPRSVANTHCIPATAHAARFCAPFDKDYYAAQSTIKPHECDILSPCGLVEKRSRQGMPMTRLFAPELPGVHRRSDPAGHADDVSAPDESCQVIDAFCGTVSPMPVRHIPPLLPVSTLLATTCWGQQPRDANSLCRLRWTLGCSTAGAYTDRALTSGRPRLAQWANVQMASYRRAACPMQHPRQLLRSPAISDSANRKQFSSDQAV
jgi:hypothetical protein